MIAFTSTKSRRKKTSLDTWLATWRQHENTTSQERHIRLGAFGVPVISSGNIARRYTVTNAPANAVNWNSDRSVIWRTTEDPLEPNRDFFILSSFRCVSMPIPNLAFLFLSSVCLSYNKRPFYQWHWHVVISACQIGHMWFVIDRWWPSLNLHNQYLTSHLGVIDSKHTTIPD